MPRRLPIGALLAALFLAISAAVVLLARNA